MTDNSVYISENGKESVRCDRGDGWGIARLHDHGLRMAVMSSEMNPVVKTRCEKLHLECFHQLGDSKIERFQGWCKEQQLEMSDIIYVGNDENDIACLSAAGFGVVPRDAHESAKNSADLILTKDGGRGAVRELCDLILKRIKTV